MGCYIDEQNKEIAELKKQIEELKGVKYYAFYSDAVNNRIW